MPSSGKVDKDKDKITMENIYYKYNSYCTGKEMYGTDQTQRHTRAQVCICSC